MDPTSDPLPTTRHSRRLSKRQLEKAPEGVVENKQADGEERQMSDIAPVGMIENGHAEEQVHHHTEDKGPEGLVENKGHAEQEQRLTENNKAPETEGVVTGDGDEDDIY